MYHINQEMQPESARCFECLCTEHFDNSTSIPENPDCKRIQCRPQLSYLNYLRLGCAPVFAPERCCAREYKCSRFP